ncbi:MAG: hypothetical protein WCJ87_05150 [Burkholderiales bacterium]
MRMLLGCVSLLVVLAIVGLLAKTQLKQVSSTAAAVAASSGAASAADIDPTVAATPATDLPRHVQDDLVRSMQLPPTRGDDSR